MITGAIKNKVDKIWDDIAAGGITNPLTVIEQLTYLMFIRSLDEKELENEAFEVDSGVKMDKIFPQSEAGQSMRWNRFKNSDPGDIYALMSQRIFPAIKGMKNGHLPDFTDQGGNAGGSDRRRGKPGREHRFRAVYGGCHVPDPYAPGAAENHHRAGGYL